MHTRIEIAKSNKTHDEKTDLQRWIPPDKKEIFTRPSEREREVKLNGNLNK